MNTPWLFIVAVGLYTAIAAVIDSRLHRVPNYLTVPAAVLGLAYHSLAPSGWGIGVSLAGFGIGFALLLLPWALGGGGMGDVKLLAALGAWLGPRWILVAFFISVAFACLLMIAMLAITACTRGFSHAKRQLKKSRPGDGSSNSRRRTRSFLPFAVPVAAGTWSVLFYMWVTLR